MTTPKLSLAEIAQSQSDKYATHNEALRGIDALLPKIAISVRHTPPGSPTNGDVYIISDGSPTATGAWAGEDGNIAWYNGSWNFVTAVEGWTMYVQGNDAEWRFDGTNWAQLLDGGVTLEDEGTTVTGGPHTTVDFVGAGVSVADAGGGQATVTINGSNQTIIYDGASPTINSTFSSMEFSGSGVSVTDQGAGAALVSITGGGGSGAGGSVGFKGASVYDASTQTISTATWTAINFDSEDYDSDSYHDTSTNNTRFTIPETGYYSLTGRATFASHATGWRGAAFDVDASGNYSGRVKVETNTTGSTTDIIANETLYLTAGSYVEFLVYQDSGGNLSVGNATAQLSNRFQITKIETATAGGQFSGVHVTTTSAQTLTNATSTALEFDSEVFDTDTYHDNVTNNTRLTAPTTGYYQATGAARFSASDVGARNLEIRVNGTDRYSAVSLSPNEDGTNSSSAVTFATLYLQAGDYVELMATQTSGGNLDTLASSSQTQPRFTLYKLETTAPTSYAVIRDAKTAGTDGGTATSGSWFTRDLTEITSDPNSIVTSLASNEFTLAAGTYLIDASAPANKVDRHAIRLYDVTGAAEVEIGSAVASSSADATPTTAFISTIITPSASNTYRIEQQVQTTKTTNGLGISINGTFTVSEEVYTVVKITKFNT